MSDMTGRTNDDHVFLPEPREVLPTVERGEGVTSGTWRGNAYLDGSGGGRGGLHRPRHPGDCRGRGGPDGEGHFTTAASSQAVPPWEWRSAWCGWRLRAGGVYYCSIGSEAVRRPSRWSGSTRWTGGSLEIQGHLRWTSCHRQLPGGPVPGGHTGRRKYYCPFSPTRPHPAGLLLPLPWAGARLVLPGVRRRAGAGHSVRGPDAVSAFIANPSSGPPRLLVPKEAIFRGSGRSATATTCSSSPTR